jgi:hypothetical protein
VRVSIIVIMSSYYFPEISFARSLADLSISTMQMRMLDPYSSNPAMF